MNNTTTINADGFGPIVVTFYRNHVETGAPLLDNGPTVWVFNSDDVAGAKAAIRELEAADHLSMVEVSRAVVK